MRFTSIALIAAASVAIAGSAVAQDAGTASDARFSNPAGSLIGTLDIDQTNAVRDVRLSTGEMVVNSVDLDNATMSRVDIDQVSNLRTVNLSGASLFANQVVAQETTASTFSVDQELDIRNFNAANAKLTTNVVYVR